MAGLYRSIQTDILALWSSGWTHSSGTIPVYWRSNDADPLPEPSEVSYFLRNEIDFGAERVIAFGGGLGLNERAQFGAVMVRIFTARAVRNEDTALDYLSDAMGVFRSKRMTGSYAAGADMSFIGEGSGFESDIVDEGNWFMRGGLVVFQYRFRG